jgi:DNA polymerase-3 subunit alpha
MADGNRFKFEGDSYYLKSPAEMRALFAELPEACDNTLAIAERCNVSFTEGNGTYMPRFPCPEGETEDSWFLHEVEAGLHRRFPGGIPDEVRRQADFETSVIISMGFAGYFLVVADFINWPKSMAFVSDLAAAQVRARSPRTRCGLPILIPWPTD